MSSTPESQARAKSVLETKAPTFSTEQAVEIAQQAFDIQATVHPLDSERDQNFHLGASDGSEWVLKIANPAEDPAILDMQSQALLHIAQADPGLEIPRVKTTPDGALFRQIDGPDGRRFIARVLSFLPGDFLDDASPHPALERNVGAMTARLARALRGFFHPAARHELLWDLTQASGLRTLTHHIRESTLRQATEEVLDHFDAEVLPRLRKLRAQLIHNDISGFNTLVDGDRVSGVIDFEDLIHAPLICDIAVPIAELMARHMEPIATAAEVTAGYHAVTALEDDELRLVFDLVSTRCVMYVAIASWRVGLHPENSDYIMCGAQKYGTLLEQMREWGSDRMYARLRRACATPISVAVPKFDRKQTDPENLQPMLERRRQHLGPGLKLSYDRPLHLVREADIIVTVTIGNASNFESSWVKPGAFIAKIGSYQELDPKLLLEVDKLIVDRWLYVSHRNPEVKELVKAGRLSESDIHAEWPDIIDGQAVGRESDDETVLYISLGIWGEYAAIFPRFTVKLRSWDWGRS